MWEIRYNFETLSTQVNIILGPYKVFDPTRWYNTLSGPDRVSLMAKFRSSQLELLCHDLDLMVPNEKDRSKRYVLFQCPNSRIPLVRTNGHSWGYIRNDILKFVSKTALIMYSTRVRFSQKSETCIKKRLDMLNKDKYDLDKIFRCQWVGRHISGKSEYFKSGSKSHYPSIDGFLMYVSIYVSRKQGWL